MTLKKAEKTDVFYEQRLDYITNNINELEKFNEAAQLNQLKLS